MIIRYIKLSGDVVWYQSPLIDDDINDKCTIIMVFMNIMQEIISALDTKLAIEEHESKRPHSSEDSDHDIRDLDDLPPSKRKRSNKSGNSSKGNKSTSSKANTKTNSPSTSSKMAASVIYRNFVANLTRQNLYKHDRAMNFKHHVTAGF